MNLLKVTLISIATISCSLPPPKSEIYWPTRLKNNCLNKNTTTDSAWIQQRMIVRKAIIDNGALVSDIIESQAFEKSISLQKYFKTKANFENEVVSYVSSRIPKPKTTQPKNESIRIVLTSIDLSHFSNSYAGYSSYSWNPSDSVAFNTTTTVELVSKVRINFLIENINGENIFEGVTSAESVGSNLEYGRDHPDYRACLQAMINLGRFFAAEPSLDPKL